MVDPPFSLGLGASNYRQLTPESDPWSSYGKYVARRDDVLSNFRLGGHEPVLWQVDVPSGGEHGGTAVTHLVRCDKCGQWTPIARRPIRRSRVFDPSGRRLDDDVTLCVPVDEAELRESVRSRHRTEKLWGRGFVGVGFAALAMMTLIATLSAPSENRPIGYLGVLLWLTVSAVAWVSFFNVFRDERTRQDWEQRLSNEGPNPTDNFVAGDSTDGQAAD